MSRAGSWVLGGFTPLPLCTQLAHSSLLSVELKSRKLPALELSFLLKEKCSYFSVLRCVMDPLRSKAVFQWVQASYQQNPLLPTSSKK